MALITLDPTLGAPGAGSGMELAPRQGSLAGQTVGIVMNRLADCELMFDALYEELGRRDDLAGLVKVTKDSQSVPPTPEQWAAVTDRATVAITGFGGCGSCSTRSMRDALDLEEMGIPAVCVVHSALLPAVKVIAEIAGRPDYPMVVVDYPHPPVATWPKEEARRIAVDIADAVRRCLVSSG